MIKKENHSVFFHRHKVKSINNYGSVNEKKKIGYKYYMNTYRQLYQLVCGAVIFIFALSNDLLSISYLNEPTFETVNWVLKVLKVKK